MIFEETPLRRGFGIKVFIYSRYPCARHDSPISPSRYITSVLIGEEWNMGAQIFRKCRNEPQIVMAIRVTSGKFHTTSPKILYANIQNFDVLLTVHLSIFISVTNQLDAQHFCFTKVYFMPLHVSSTCVHHQEVKIALNSLWYHHTYRWPSRAQVERGLRPLSTCARDGHL